MSLSRRPSDSDPATHQRPGYWRSGLAACLLGWICWLPPVLATPLQITVVQSERGGAYDEFTAALRSSLSSATRLIVLDAGQPVAGGSSDLFIAVGMKAASQLAASDAAVILNVMIPKSGHAKLIAEFPQRRHAGGYSSIYLDQPVERQLALIAAAYPDRHRVGVMYVAPIDETTASLRRRAAEFGLQIHEHEVSDKESLFQALQDVLQHSDVLLATPAPTIFNGNTLRNILVSTYQSNIPLVGFSAAYVRAGATCAVFSTPSQFATQAVAAVSRYSQTGQLPPSQYPRQFEVAVNERVARSMNLDIPSAEQLLKQIGQTLGGTP